MDFLTELPFSGAVLPASTSNQSVVDGWYEGLLYLICKERGVFNGKVPIVPHPQCRTGRHPV